MNKPVFTIHSNAKINLCLRITERQPDGYHHLSSIFQEIDLYDILTFYPDSEYSIRCDTAAIPCDHHNLCSRAYQKMKQLAQAQLQNWRIHLQKKIPVGAGLGGGSSNAATVLKFLNRQWNLRLSEKKLLNIARQIGADVAFFIRGKTQLAEGIGDILTPLGIPGNFYILLVIPNFSISTPWAYQQFDLTKKIEGNKFGCLLKSGKIQWALFENQFESVVFPTYPEIGDIKNHLLSTGAMYAGLSGSGSTVFGIFKNRPAAAEAQKYFKKHSTFITTPVT